MIVIEEHLLTAEVLAVWNDMRLQACDPSVAAHSGAVESRLLDLADEWVALMDETALTCRCSP